MEKGGVSPRRGIILVGVMLFLYGITAFVYEHGMRVSMSHLKIMLVLIQTIVCSMFVFANFLMDFFGFGLILRWSVQVLLWCIYGLICMKPAVICLICIYQRYAPDSVRRKRRFEPSCSVYMIQAVEKYGVYHGIRKGINRLRRCKPGFGGFEPLE